MPGVITLDNSSDSICYLCTKDKRLAKVINTIGPISYSVHDDKYTFLIHEIIEQMLSIKAGQTIYRKLEDLCEGEITPQRIILLSDEEIKSTGTSWAKVSYIRSLTEAIISRQLNLDDIESMTDDDVIKILTSIRGIGPWSAKMYLIFALNRPDVLPYEDVAFLQGFCWLYKTDDRSKKTVISKCKKWSPYASIAARYMYKAVDLGLTKTEFHLFK